MAAARPVVQDRSERADPTLASARPAARPTAVGAETPRVDGAPSPARALQAQLHRAFTPEPVRPDQFSKRRALKLIAPTSVALWALIAFLNHAGHG